MNYLPLCAFELRKKVHSYFFLVKYTGINGLKIGFYLMRHIREDSSLR